MSATSSSSEPGDGSASEAVRRLAGQASALAMEGMDKVGLGDKVVRFRPKVPPGREAEYANIAGPGVNV